MKRSLLAVTLVGFCMVPLSSFGQQDGSLSSHITSLEGNLNIFCPDGLPARLVASAKAMERLASEETELDGTVAFSYDGSQSDDLEVDGERVEGSSINNIGTGIVIGRGHYPGKLEVNQVLRIQLKDGQFTEDVSAANISYDYYLHPQVESYAFVNRYSDGFLSIDQRYEIGGGVDLELDVGSSKPSMLTAKGAQLQREVLVGRPNGVTPQRWEELLGDGAAVLPLLSEATLQRCFVKAFAKTAADEAAAEAALNDTDEDEPQPESDRLSETDRWRSDTPELLFDEFEADYKEQAHLALTRIRKRYSRLRFSVLLGAFAELESATIKVSVSDSIDISVRLPGQQGLRVEARPSFRYRLSDAISLRADYFAKLAIAGFESDEDAEAAGLGPVDIRHLGISSLNWNLGKVTMSIGYRILYDTRPPFLLTANATNTNTNEDSEIGPIVARKRRDSWQLSFGVGF